MLNLNVSFVTKTFHFKMLFISPSGKFDINLKCIYAMRTIVKGHSAGNVLCSLMKLLSPVQKCEAYNNKLFIAVDKCAHESMISAASEYTSVNNGCTNLAVAIGGTWQKRGHTSLNGVLSVSSVDTGKVLDLVVTSQYRTHLYGCSRSCASFTEFSPSRCLIC